MSSRPSQEQTAPPSFGFSAAAGSQKLVPIQQAELMLDKLKSSVGVETKLVVKPGAEHGWPNLVKDLSIVADWFDTQLKAKKVEPPTPKP